MMQRKTLSEAEEIEAHMRSVCGKICEAMPEQQRLKTIAAIGAYDGQIGGEGIDSRRLTQIMMYLLKSGVAIDPEFEIDVVNLREGRNFLMEQKQADLLYIAFILQETSRDTQYFRPEFRRRTESDDYRDFFGLMVGKHHSPQAWRERIESTGAKVVATFGGDREVGTHTLCDVPEAKLKALVESPKFPAVGNVTRDDADPKIGGFILRTHVSIADLYNGKANDLPIAWLGFAAREEYIKEAGPSLFEDTTLGRNARNMALALS